MNSSDSTEIMLEMADEAMEDARATMNLGVSKLNAMIVVHFLDEGYKN